MYDSQVNPLIRPALPPHLEDVLAGITAGTRARFGHDAFRMEEGGDGGAPPAGGTPPAGQPPAGGGQGGEGGTPPAAGAPPTPTEDVASLPDWAQKLIKDTRAEAATHRTGKTAAEQKYQDTLDAIAKGLGLKGEEQPDPAKLAGDLTAAQQAQRDAAAELVVWRNATALGVDPQAVTDSRAFERAIKDLDPTDAKAFEEAVKKAAQEAAEQNPKLKAAPAAGKGGAELNGGSGEGANSSKPKTLGDAVRKHYGA